MISPARTLTVALRVLRQVRRDPRTIGLLLVVPSLLTGLVAWMFTDTDTFADIGPAMIALFPFVVMFLVTSIATLRERRSGTLERALTLPLTKLDLLVGYLLAFSLLALAQTAVTVAFAVWVCGLDLSGGAIGVAAVAVLNAVLGTALGLLASAFASTEFQVVQFMPAFVFPQVLLGGLFIARDRLPAALETVGDVLPLSYGFDALDAAASGAGFADYGTDVAAIGAWIVASIVLAAVSLRRRTP